MLRRNWRTAFIFLSILVDLMSICLASGTAYAIRMEFTTLPFFDLSSLAHLTLYFAAVILFVCMLMGLYRSAFHSSSSQQFYIATKSYFLSALIILSSLYVLQQKTIPPRLSVIFLLFLPLFFSLGRLLLDSFNNTMKKKGFGVHYSVLVGYDLTRTLPLDGLAGFSELGYEIKGIVLKDIKRSGVFRTKDGRSFPTYALPRACELLLNNKIDRVFVPSAAVFTNGFSPILELSRQRGIKVKIVSSDSEELLRFSHVNDVAGISLYSPPRNKTEFLKAKSKRIGDLLASIILLIILSPIIATVSLAILLEDGMPIFYKQKRAVVRGRGEFWFYKFRSMEKNAEAKQIKLYEKNQTAGGLFLLKNDPRLTHIGKLIRKYSIDELPQLINVLKGDMSLVGPRPLSLTDLHNIAQHDHLEEAFKLRAKAKPGMTGLWQICGRRDVAFNEMLLLDLYYIENQSLIFDLEILFATIPVVLFGKGAY